MPTTASVACSCSIALANAATGWMSLMIRVRTETPAARRGPRSNSCISLDELVPTTWIRFGDPLRQRLEAVHGEDLGLRCRGDLGAPAHGGQAPFGPIYPDNDAL